MLSVSPGTRIYLATEPVDLRRGHDGLTALVRARFGMDPLQGHLFVFVGRRVDRVKILFWDRAVMMRHLQQAIAGGCWLACGPRGASSDGARRDRPSETNKGDLESPRR